MAAVLNAMSALVREVRERGKRIDPKVFRAILYIVPAPFGVGPPLDA